MESPEIKSAVEIIPKIYCYSLPKIDYRVGWVKIGYTQKQTPEERIKQQTHTAGIIAKKEWDEIARFKRPPYSWFTDSRFHSYLVHEKFVERDEGNEFFKITGDEAHSFFDEFIGSPEKAQNINQDYVLRAEQQEAVDLTKECFESGETEFLWNAKPRFGKTLTSYELCREMNLKNVLIVTNRPSIANSWFDDFYKFISWRGEYCFVSDNEALKNKNGVYSSEDYQKLSLSDSPNKDLGVITFESLQGLKGSVHFGGSYNKLGWIKDFKWDLLIVDESQEGIDTILTERAFQNINRKYTLYLSGTAFKQLAKGNFKANQIFNWTYIDEQEAKTNWTEDGANPYENMPRLALYTYKLSDMVLEKIQRGMDLSEEENVDYVFDLNEFFLTNEQGDFVHRDDVKKFLHALTTQDKYPFSTEEQRNEMSHTLWLLNRVASAKALAKMLKEDEVFKDYEVVVAAGDGKLDDKDNYLKSIEKVRKAIKNHDKTITLSVGQLTVGVTIPEWSGVMMLCNLESASSYIQAIFRSQNPYIFDKNGKRYMKETAYVFDFDPARTLKVYEEYANNVCLDTAGGKGTGDDRKKNVEMLLNFFPVIAEDTEGSLEEIDAAKLLSIPRVVRCAEVVRRGFMSNFLFHNISHIFSAPNVIKEIIDKIPRNGKKPKNAAYNKSFAVDNVDENGEVHIPDSLDVGEYPNLFGKEKLYAFENELKDDIDPILSSEQKTQTIIDGVGDSLVSTIQNLILDKVFDEYKIAPSNKNSIKKEFSETVKSSFNNIVGNYNQKLNEAALSYEEEKKNSVDEKIARQAYEEASNDAKAEFNQNLTGMISDISKNAPDMAIKRAEEIKAEKQKKSVEDSVRDHLRGFARTIPSFIMAYGDRNLKLSNFEEYVEDPVFEEVTGLTKDEFRFLRDGGDVTDDETGELKHFKGNLFDEVVFDDSIQEFLNKREELANYFKEGQKEDIFDYIPPQKTNQIFTPRWVVELMVDELEEENPGCFDDPNNTFADLYMKSGMYITEIVKRLFNSKKMREIYPDDNERIRHILRKQVYGLAPNRIIYLIATNYILGFDEALRDETRNFAEADAVKAAKEGTLKELVDSSFSED